MGDVIYINPGDNDPFADIEARLRSALDQYGDGDSASWMVEMIHNLCEIPELTFQISMTYPADIGKQKIDDIDQQVCSVIKDRCEKIKYGMLNAFIQGYFEKKHRESFE